MCLATDKDTVLETETGEAGEISAMKARWFQRQQLRGRICDTNNSLLGI
jgi:hypothetical protein